MMSIRRFLIPSLAVPAAILASIALTASGCESDGGSGSTGGAGGGGSGADPGAGPANEVKGQVSGGSAAGTVEGESEASQQGLYHGAVVGGELLVYLASADGSILHLKVDTAFGEIPGSFSVGRALDGAGFVTYTHALAGQILEGEGGSITVNQCPNEVGAVVTGEVSGVDLVSPVTESPDGTFDGSWRVTIVSSDGSAKCKVVADPDPDPEPGPTGTTSCTNEACDGPCCPYLLPLQQCFLGCTDLCADPTKAFECLGCFEGCPDESGITGDAECKSAWQALDQCGTAAGCSDFDAAEDECMAAACCTEYRAAF